MRWENEKNMKKIIFGLIATLSISNLSFGQITLEHSYVSNKWQYEESNAFMTDSGINYYTYNNATNTMLIYNNSHTLIKTVNIPVDAGYYINYFYAISDKLFNSDIQIEFIIAMNEISGTNKKLNLINENGTVLQQFGNKNGLKIIKESSSEFKMATYLSPNSSSSNFNIDIYSLPGTYLNLISNKINENSLFGYPNPSENIIYINSNLEIGQRGTLEVFDMNGKKVMEKNVIGENNEISLNISELNSGVYLYRLNDQTNKFIKK